MVSYLSCNNKATSYTPGSPVPCFPGGFYSLTSLAQGLHNSRTFGPGSHIYPLRGAGPQAVSTTRCWLRGLIWLHFGGQAAWWGPFPLPAAGCSVTELSPPGTCSASPSWAADDSLGSACHVSSERPTVGESQSGSRAARQGRAG